MQFCPKCGSLLIQKRKRFACAKCGRASSEKVSIATSEKMKERQSVGLLKEKESSVWPKTVATCPKCGHNEAFFWSAQTRVNDEGETRFFQCTKCKHTWREYS